MGSPPLRPAAFVGRTEELDALLDAYEVAAEGQLVPVVLVGEPGIGKTRLAEEVTARARARGIPVHWGRCLEAGGTPALWPWTQVLDAIGGEDSPHRLPALADDRADQFATFDAIAHVLADHGDKPRIVVLDDVHQADLASLELLRFLTRAAADVPLLVIATKRRNATVADPDRDVLLGELSQFGRRVELPALERAEVEQIVADLGASDASDDVVDRILTRSGGNTLYVDELARVVTREGTEALDTIPSGVRAAVRKRLAPLGPSARRALEAAAVFAQPVDAQSLALVLDREVRDVLDDLEPALLIGVAVSDEPGQFRLPHALIQDAIYQGLSSAERADLHRLVAVALTGSARRPAAAAEVAEHFVKAGALAEPVEAAEWASHAAAEARRLHASRAAAGWEEVAADRWREAGKEAEWVESTLTAAVDRANQGDAQRSIELANAVVEEARRSGSAELLARAVLARLAAWDPRQGDDGVMLIQEVLDHPDAAQLGSMRFDLLAQLVSLTGMPGLEGPPMDAALAHRALEEMEAIAGDGKEDRSGEMASLRLTIEHGPGMHADRRAWLRQLEDAALGRQDRVGRTERRYWATSIAFEAGDLDAVASNLAEWEAAAELTSSAFWRWRASTARASLAYARGRFDEAERLATESLPLVAGLYPQMAMQVVGGLVLGIRYEQGRLDEVTEHMSEDTLGMIAVLVPISRGDRSGAARLVDELVEQEASTSPGELHWLCLMSMIARGAACAGDEERCRWVVEQLTPFADQCVMFGRSYVFGGPVTELLGLAHRVLGDDAAAAEAFESALGWADRNGADSWGVHALLGLASVLDDGDEHRKVALLQRASETARRLGMAPSLAEANEALQSLARRTDPTGPARRAGLVIDGEGDDAGQVCASVRTLGGFAVVPAGGDESVRWTSKKARDALKILTCHRGRAVPREELIEQLWPDVDLPTGRSRLSVVLSMVRAALDPAKRWPADHAVAATRDSVALRLDHVDVDVEEFLTLVQRGLLDQASESGQRDLVRAVDEVWRGPFLSEDRYEDWTASLRSRIDAAQASALRALAQAAQVRGTIGEAIVRFGQLVEIDPYDEGANRQLLDALVAAGSHGEAQRHHEVFTARMRELGLPDPAPLELRSVS